MQGNNLTDKQVDALSCNERCRMFNLNPVVVAKHTRKELKHSSLVLLADGKPTGKIVCYYALTAKF